MYDDFQKTPLTEVIFGQKAANTNDRNGMSFQTLRKSLPEMAQFLSLMNLKSWLECSSSYKRPQKSAKRQFS